MVGPEEEDKADNQQQESEKEVQNYEDRVEDGLTGIMDDEDEGD